ncbi:unnamed protein product [Echinostoma caproni]|uniref:PDZ domain-containing protein n=1 Tax=Echinostoma caproni TaxID=27848 RepID=A0A183A509_9TREM|nr:unnamed protein product [Echinostoma caproni]
MDYSLNSSVANSNEPNCPVNPSSFTSAIDTTVVIPITAKGCGFRLSQEPIEDNMLSVTAVDPETLSTLSNCVAVGDLLVAVDGQSVAGLDQDGVVQLMQLHSLSNSTDGTVRLTFRGTRKSQSTKPDNISQTTVLSESNGKQPGKFRFRSFIPSKPGTTSSPITSEVKPSPNMTGDDLTWTTPTLQPVTNCTDNEDMLDAYNVELRRQENEGFGFVIVSSLNSNKASEIGRIIPGSPADKCGQLRVGNRIVAINGQMLSGLHHTEIVQLIRKSQQHLVLTVQRPRKNSDLMVEWKPVTVDHDQNEATNCHNDSTQEALQQPVPTESFEPSHSDQSETIPVQLVYAVTLRRGPQGFGFSIRGGVDFERIPLFVFRIAKGGPAQLDGRMQIGDEIVKINGLPTYSFTHKQAVDAIRQSGDHLSLLLSRLSSRLCETGV